MRPLLPLLAFASSLVAAPPAPFSIARALISDAEGGAALPASFDHIPGETLFFSCRIAGYQKTAQEKIHLAYSVQAFDPQGVPLVELFKNEISDEVTPQDKEWMPKIQTEIPIPPLISSGTYKIVVKAEDLVAKTTTELTIPFQVRARQVEPSETLTVRNFRLLRTEDDGPPLERRAYRPGDTMWARFEIVGFQYGPKNKIDVGYVVSILDNAGKVLWTQPEGTSEQTESFYPKRYVSAAFSIEIQKDTHPGTFALGVQVKDATGNQTYETKEAFSVE